MADEITTNEVLAVKLDYISKDIGTIKKDISDIKTENIGRREFETHIKDSEDKIRARFVLSDQKMDDLAEKAKAASDAAMKEATFATKAVYGTIGVVFLTIAGAVMKSILK